MNTRKINATTDAKPETTYTVQLNGETVQVDYVSYVKVCNRLGIKPDLKD